MFYFPDLQNIYKEDEPDEYKNSLWKDWTN